MAAMLVALAARASAAAAASAAIFLSSGTVISPLASRSPVDCATTANGRSAAAARSGFTSLLPVTFWVSASFEPSSFIEPISAWHSGPFLLQAIADSDITNRVVNVPNRSDAFMQVLLRVVHDILDASVSVARLGAPAGLIEGRRAESEFRVRRSM